MEDVIQFNGSSECVCVQLQVSLSEIKVKRLFQVCVSVHSYICGDQKLEIHQTFGD